MKKADKLETPRETAADINLYEYAVIRYVPKVEREEFINIGLIMMCKRRRWLRCEIQIDDIKIKALFPMADTGLLRCQSQLFTKNDVPENHLPVEETYRWLTAAKSAILQVSPSHPGIATDTLDATFSRLFHELVE